MSFTGHVHNGVVVFDEPVTLPEGTEVEIAVRTESKQATHFDRFKEIIVCWFSLNWKNAKFELVSKG